MIKNHISHISDVNTDTNNSKELSKIPFASGVDTLYYFCESSTYYDDYYLDILEQIAECKNKYEELHISYQNNDIIVTINDIEVKYSGKGRDGFHWFNHEFFRIGFKDQEKNPNIHNICVQLNALGIYTLGLQSLIKYVNEKLLKDIMFASGTIPITRIDLNMFIQHDFSYLKKEMVVSKKKNHKAIYSENTSSSKVESYYIGKNPFKLRIYNKHKELSQTNSIKKEVMYNYFTLHKFDIQKPIWNVEFELHREFLKKYGILTIEDALSSSDKLFQYCCELIRFIDINSISEKQVDSKNRRLANNLPIWDYIKANYSNGSFLQSQTPLSKVETISYRYTLDDAKKPIKRVIKKLLLNNSPPTLNYFLELILEVKEFFELKGYQSENKEDYALYSNEGLISYKESLLNAMKNEEYESIEYNELLNFYNNVYKELVKRGLEDEIPF